nr:putative reverse transcriptase domain-containing protein [Tanacetum cinerariifolium]
ASPTTPTEIHQFLGLVGYYQRFIKDFSKIVKSLTELTQKNKKYIWGEDQETTFQLLKQKLCEALILALPEGNDNFIVYYDASHQGLGAVLMQREKGSLPSNTIANPRGDVKAITTQSGVAYDGPMIPPTPSPLLKVVVRETEVTKDKVKTTISESTIHVQPLVVQISIPEPDVASKPKPSILLHFNLNFADALLHIPKFSFTYKSLLSNKGKLFELANTSLIENCSAKLSLPDLTPTRMTLELATRSFAYPAGIAKDVFMQVSKFTFPADFIAVDYDVDPHVPLILGRPFLRMAMHSINMINFIEIKCEDRFPEVLKFKKSDHPSSGSTTPFFDSSPSLTPFETGDSLLEEFADELALLDLIPPRKVDNNFDFEANLREIEFLFHQDPSTEFNIETINPILEKFTDEPSLNYLPPSRDDDDDIFNLKSDNDEWKSFCMLLDNGLTHPKESSEDASLSLFPFENEDKIHLGSLGQKKYIEEASISTGRSGYFYPGYGKDLWDHIKDLFYDNEDARAITLDNYNTLKMSHIRNMSRSVTS